MFYDNYKSKSCLKSKSKTLLISELIRVSGIDATSLPFAAPVNSIKLKYLHYRKDEDNFILFDNWKLLFGQF